MVDGPNVYVHMVMVVNLIENLRFLIKCVSVFHMQPHSFPTKVALNFFQSLLKHQLKRKVS